MNESNSMAREKSKNKNKKRKRLGERVAQLNSKPLVFYDHSRHPAAVLHELHPEITSDQYEFNEEGVPSSSIRFRCSICISDGLETSITGHGVGRSKQLAKNMAAQQALIKLYPTYCPPAEALLAGDSVASVASVRYDPSVAPSLSNDPSLWIDSIRRHLTTASLALKSPSQLFNEMFMSAERRNSCTSMNNGIHLIDNDENVIVVRVTAMDRHFWSVSREKNLAIKDACQQAIESLCNVSFRLAKNQFVDALRSMGKISLPSEPAIEVESMADVSSSVAHDIEEL